MKKLLINTKRAFKKYSLKYRNNRKIIYIVNLALVFCIFSLLFVHLSETNKVSPDGFVLRKLYSELDGLKEDNRALTLKSAEMQSITRIKDVSTKELGMVKADGKNYITIALNDNKTIVKK